MARLRESLIIDEISFFEEPLGGNQFLTMKNMFYGLFAMLVGYKLIYSGKPAAELIGVLLLLFIGFLVAYPKRSLTAESLLIGLISYYLGFGQQTKNKEEMIRKKKEERKKTTVPIIPNITSIRNVLRGLLGKTGQTGKSTLNVKAPKALTPQLTAQKSRKLAINFSLIDYIIVIIGIVSGTFGVIMFNKAFWSLNVNEVYIATVVIIVGFSVSIERILEKLVRR
ncbi:hypothetical protein STK_13130 [Sulfurisphaera tokodaii str. 7]|uniref:Uncharacterized protein n=1 Tax=Sulfurisphaera tokodaii (strain DSM 16993 / JCM 10545 / NBRC 100140 / 7) TaxID=273063 RepID=Q971Q2_SULTO|nr:hypothetical protein [Sulfurisphaera tokodaii]BAB66368.1 hypothetical protein STK_13130 [Sulfurisphaera tokodaii str. 7]